MDIFWQHFLVYIIVTVSTAALVLHYWNKSVKKQKTYCNNCGCNAKKRLKNLKNKTITNLKNIA